MKNMTIGLVVSMGWFSLACGGVDGVMGSSGGGADKAPEPVKPAYQAPEMEEDPSEALPRLCAYYDAKQKFVGGETKGKWRLDDKGLWVEAWTGSDHIMYEQPLTGLYVVDGSPLLVGPDGAVGCATTAEEPDPLAAGEDLAPWVLVQDAGAGPEQASAVAAALQQSEPNRFVLLGETAENPRESVEVLYAGDRAELGEEVVKALGTGFGAVEAKAWPDKTHPAPLVVAVGAPGAAPQDPADP